MVRTRSSKEACLTVPPPKKKRGRPKRCFPNSAEPIAKPSETNLVYHRIKRLLNDQDGVFRFSTSTIQPSGTKTQHEKEVSHEAIQNFQLGTEGVGTEHASNFLSVPNPIIPDPGRTDEMDLLDTLNEESSSQGGNNITHHGPGEHSSNCVLGRRLPQKTTSLNFTEIAERLVNDELDDEIDSFESSTTLVVVGNYRIKPKYEVPVRDILLKFGDIAASCNEESVAFRSFCMEYVCETIQKMDTKIDFLKETDLEEMMSGVILLENANVDIGWLKTRLIKINEAIKAIQFLRKHRQGPAASRKCELQKMKNQWEVYRQEIVVKQAEIEAKQAAIEAEQAAIVVKQAEIEDLGNKLHDVKCNISAAEDESKNVDKEISESRAKLRYIVELGSLVAGFK